MEKRTPHCKLSKVKTLVSAGRVTTTSSAAACARQLGIRFQGMCDVVLALNPAEFYKSMTTHADHRVWQDVYHTKTACGVPLYVKLSVVDDVLIVSFKEL